MKAVKDINDTTLAALAHAEGDAAEKQEAFMRQTRDLFSTHCANVERLMERERPGDDRSRKVRRAEWEAAEALIEFIGRTVRERCQEVVQGCREEGEGDFRSIKSRMDGVEGGPYAKDL